MIVRSEIQKMLNKTNKLRNVASGSSFFVDALFVFALTFLLFLPALKGGFQEMWDDKALLLANSAYRGFSFSHLKWMFSSVMLGHWQPLSWLSYALDFSLYDLNPAGFHLTNVVLHAFNAVILYFIIRNLLSRIGSMEVPGTQRIPAVLAALFFSIHPLRVEPVVWIATRGYLLCSFFVLLSLLLYLRAVPKRYPWGAWLCFVLATFSKGIGMMLPAVLLVLDFWPLGRFGRSGVGACGSEGGEGFTTQPSPKALAGTAEGTKTHKGEDSSQRRRGRRGFSLSRVSKGWKKLSGLRSHPSSFSILLLEKLPFFLLSLLGGAVAFWAKHAEGRMVDFANKGLLERIGQAAYNFWLYFWKTIWPARLSPLYYTLPPLRDEMLLAAAAALLVLLVFMKRKQHPWLLASLSVYGLFVFPMLGITQSGVQVAADRFTYLATLPFAICIGGMLLCVSKKKRSFAFWVTGLLWMALGIQTFCQQMVWRNESTLWKHAVLLDRQNAAACNNLAAIFDQSGCSDQALQLYLQAAEVDPSNATARLARRNRAALYYRLGELELGVKEMGAALAELPEDYGRRYMFLLSRARFSDRLGDQEGMLRDLKEAIESPLINPEARAIIISFLREQETDGENP